MKEKGKKILKGKEGITLIALVITIIVLLILAGVAISMLTGDNGLLTIAATSKDETEKAAVQEAISLAYMNALAQYYEDGTSIVETMQEELESQYGEGNVTITETDGVYTVTIDGTEYTIDGTADNGTTSEGTTGTEDSTDEDTIETTTSYCSTSAVSYYADVDGDGEVDGIIFADLAIGGSGEWGSNGYGPYSYDAVSSSSLKEYTISEDTYTDTYFGEGYIITKASGTSGEDRFYVMALEDIDSSSHWWYYNAYGNLPDEKMVSGKTNDFGEGLSNTQFWLEAYENETYGDKYTGELGTDLWSLTDSVGTNVGTSDSIWFVPSNSEWAAFGDTFGMTSSNYSSSFGFEGSYWSSSVYSAYIAYYCCSAWGYMNGGSVYNGSWIRLCTTF